MTQKLYIKVKVHQKIFSFKNITNYYWYIKHEVLYPTTEKYLNAGHWENLNEALAVIKNTIKIIITKIIK